MTDTLNNKEPIFIVGVPRSGTTLMSSILSTHPAIAICPSTKFISTWMRQNSHLDISNPVKLKIFWEKFSKSKNFSRIGIDSEVTLSHIYACDSIDFKSIFHSILSHYAIKMQKTRLGEKTPSHYAYVNQLLNCDEWAKTYVSSVMRPINKDSINQWQKNLTVHQIAVVECLCRPFMIAQGYSPITEGLSFSKSMWLFITIFITKVLGKMSTLNKYD
jgi:hypothetical protein